MSIASFMFITLVATTSSVGFSEETLQSKTDICNSGVGPGALDACNELIQSRLLVPADLATVFYSRGTIRLSSKEYEQAIEDYSEAIRLKPDFAAAILNRGVGYNEAGQYRKAIDDCDRFIRLRPDQPNGYGIRAATYDSMKLYAKAVSDYDRVISLEPKPSALSLAGRGAAREEMGLYADALSDFDAAIGLDAKNWIFLNRGCWLRAVTNRELRKALQLCDDAIKLSRSSASNYTAKGFILYRLADFPGAVEALNEGIGVDAHSADAYFLRGMTRKRKGDTTSGDADIAAAKAIDPKIAETYAGYGVTP